MRSVRPIASRPARRRKATPRGPSCAPNDNNASVFGDSGRTPLFQRNQSGNLANLKNTPIESIGENSGLANRSEASEMENPGALAGATGAECCDHETTSKAYRTGDSEATGNWQGIGSLAALTATRARHQSAARMFRHTLALNRAEVWVEFGFVAAVRLLEDERAMAAYSLLRTLDPDMRERIMSAAHWGSM